MKCILSGWSIALCLLSVGFLPQVKAVLVEETGAGGSTQSINRPYATGNPAIGDTLGQVAFTAEASGAVTTYTQITSKVSSAGYGQAIIAAKTAAGLMNIAQFDSAGLNLLAGKYTGDGSLLNYLNMSAASSGLLTVLYGGTGLSSVAQGSLLYGSGSNNLSTLPKDTNATRYLSNQGASNAPVWSRVNVTNGTTGTLPMANGGTGATAFLSGAVPFSNGSALAQDNEFYWDATNNRMRLGSNNSSYAGGLTVSSGPLVVPSSNLTWLQPSSGGMAVRIGCSNSAGYIDAGYIIPGYSAGDYPLYVNTAQVTFKSDIKLLNLADDPAQPTGGAILYSIDGELWAQDTTGNLTVNSPHRFELFQPATDDPAPWSFYSKNSLTGKIVNVDMSGAMRELERLSGKKFIYYSDLETSETKNSEAWITHAKDEITSTRKQLQLAAQPYEIIEPDDSGKLPARIFMQAEITSIVTQLETRPIKVLDAEKMCVVTKEEKVMVQKKVGTGRFQKVLKPGWEFREDGKLYRQRTMDEIKVPAINPEEGKLPDWVLSRAKARVQKEKQAAEK